MGGNLESRLRRLERGYGMGDYYPLVIAPAQGETVDQAVERHLSQSPGFREWLTKHPGRPLVVLDGEHGD